MRIPLAATVLVMSLGLGGVGCGAPATQGYGPLDPTAYIEARALLAALRRERDEMRTETIALTIDAPYMPSRLVARGAVAIRPPDAIRMILLGPGGTTAMDLWSVDDRYRFAIPALDIVRVGSLLAPIRAERGLPVDFLRWWLLDPLGGRLLAARRLGNAEGGAGGAGLELLIATDERTTTAIVHDDGRISAHRSWWSPHLVDEEWIEATSLRCGTVVYRQRSTQLVVRATCEASRKGATVRAFDPPTDLGPAVSSP